MSMGWGGIVAGALAGGAAGGMNSMAKDIDEQMKQEAQAARDRALAKLQRENNIATHAANAQTDIANIAPKAAATSAALDAEAPAALRRKVDEQDALLPGKVREIEATEAVRNRSRILPAGARLLDKDGNVLTEAEAKTLTPEEAELAKARARQADAAAREHDAGAEKKRREPAEKPEKPDNLKAQNYKPTGKRGEEYDEVTRTFRKTVKGTEEVPEDKGTFGFGAKPAVPGKPTRVEYTDEQGNPISMEEIDARRRERSGYSSGTKSEPASASPKTNYIKDKVYVDKNGNRAVWTGTTFKGL